MIRVWRIPFSTNVERVALALGHKGLEAEWVDVDPSDRSAVVEVSGQPLVPVLEDAGAIFTDSPRILEYLEERYPEPPLLPLDDARRAEARVVVDWFNRVWKRAPNLLVELGYDDGRSAGLSAEIESSLDIFEALLAGRTYLFGDELSLVDVTAFPFLKYAVAFDPTDDDPFHATLHRHLALNGRRPRLAGWIERVDAHPRA